MTTAPAADQVRLLDVQALDTHLAKLAHQRKTHPTITALAELTARAEDLTRAKTAAEVLVSDTRRELTKAETDVEQVTTRAARNQQRLDAGAGSPKDLQALGHELARSQSSSWSHGSRRLDVAAPLHRPVAAPASPYRRRLAPPSPLSRR